MMRLASNPTSSLPNLWDNSEAKQRDEVGRLLHRTVADIPSCTLDAKHMAANLAANLLKRIVETAAVKSFGNDQMGVRQATDSATSNFGSARARRSRAILTAISKWRKAAINCIRTDRHACGAGRRTPQANSTTEAGLLLQRYVDQGASGHAKPKRKLQPAELCTNATHKARRIHRTRVLPRNTRAPQQVARVTTRRGRCTHPLWVAVQGRHPSARLDKATLDGSWRELIASSVARAITNQWVAPFGTWKDFTAASAWEQWFQPAPAKWSLSCIRVSRQDKETLGHILQHALRGSTLIIRPHQALHIYREARGRGEDNYAAAKCALDSMELMLDAQSTSPLHTMLASDTNIPLIHQAGTLLRPVSIKEAATLQHLTTSTGPGFHLCELVQNAFKLGRRTASASWAYSCIMDSIHGEAARQLWLNADSITTIPRHFLMGSLYSGALCAITTAVLQETTDRCTPVLFVERDPLRREVLRRSYTSARIEEEVLSTMRAWEGALPHVMAVTAPCEHFSAARWGSMQEVHTNNAERQMEEWTEVIDIITRRCGSEKPRVILMENVAGLATRFKRLYDRLHTSIITAGYHITHARRCPAEHYNGACRRPRLLWVCTLRVYLK
jgi:hypothetical protein